jgi:hypothetical protein
VLLGVAVLTVVATGIGHAAGVTGRLAGVSAMQVHVGAALTALPLAVWHVLARPSRPRAGDLSRRSLVRASGVVAVAGLVWSAGEGVWALAGTPGARRRVTGSHERGSGDPQAMPVTQWLFDRVPATDPSGWRLQVGGPAGEEGTRAVEELAAGDTVRAVLDCTGGWYAEQEWEGIRLDRLLGPTGTARSVLVRSVTGYSRRFPVTDVDRLWLVITCAGRPLSAGHGGPVRLVAPGRRGFWWVKWVDRVALDEVPAWRQPPFPLQ